MKGKKKETNMEFFLFDWISIPVIIAYENHGPKNLKKAEPNGNNNSKLNILFSAGLREWKRNEKNKWFLRS